MILILKLFIKDWIKIDPKYVKFKFIMKTNITI